MKFLGMLLVLILLFFGGYFLQPMITPMLVKDQPSREVTVREVTVNGFKVDVDLKNLEADLIPRELTLKDAVSLFGEGDEEGREVAKGATVSLVEVKGGQLMIADPADEKLTAMVSSVATDVFERAAKLKFEASQKRVAMNETPVPMPEKVEPEVPERVENPLDPSGGKMPETSEEVPEVVEAPAEMPESEEKDPVVADAPAAGPISAEEIVSLMKESVTNGLIREFTVDRVETWVAGEPETVDGVEYEVGVASYQAETIFGVRPVEAKALIRDGKVEKWVYAKTGMEIR